MAVFSTQSYELLSICAQMGHSAIIRNCYLGGIIISIIYIDKTIAVSAKIIKFWNTVLDLTAPLDKAIISFTKHALALMGCT